MEKYTAYKHKSIQGEGNTSKSDKIDFSKKYYPGLEGSLHTDKYVNS